MLEMLHYVVLLFTLAYKTKSNIAYNFNLNNNTNQQHQFAVETFVYLLSFIFFFFFNKSGVHVLTHCVGQQRDIVLGSLFSGQWKSNWRDQ